MQRGTEPGRVLVIYKNSRSTALLAKSAVEKLLYSGIPVRVCTDGCDGGTVFPGNPLPDADNTGALLEGVCRVVIASLPLFILKKVLELDDSEPLSNVILSALCAGIPVEAVDSGLYPPTFNEKLCPSGLLSLLNERFQKLSAAGIKIVKANSEDGKSCGEVSKRRVITADDILAAKSAGRELKIESGDIVTPMAMDLIKENLKRKGGFE